MDKQKKEESIARISSYYAIQSTTGLSSLLGNFTLTSHDLEVYDPDGNMIYQKDITEEYEKNQENCLKKLEKFENRDNPPRPNHAEIEYKNHLNGSPSLKSHVVLNILDKNDIILAEVEFNKSSLLPLDITEIRDDLKTKTTELDLSQLSVVLDKRTLGKTGYIYLGYNWWYKSHYKKIISN